MDEDAGKLYVFGGAKKKRFFHDIQAYSISDGTWEAIKVTLELLSPPLVCARGVFPPHTHTL